MPRRFLAWLKSRADLTFLLGVIAALLATGARWIGLSTSSPAQNAHAIAAEAAIRHATDDTLRSAMLTLQSQMGTPTPGYTISDQLTDIRVLLCIQLPPRDQQTQHICRRGISP